MVDSVRSNLPVHEGSLLFKLGKTGFASRTHICSSMRACETVQTIGPFPQGEMVRQTAFLLSDKETVLTGSDPMSPWCLPLLNNF